MSTFVKCKDKDLIQPKGCFIIPVMVMMMMTS